MNLRCRHYQCEVRDLMENLVGHEGVCDQREVSCPGRMSNRCKWQGLMSELAGHIREKDCGHIAAHPPMYMVKDKNEIIFRGSLMNVAGHNIFEARRVEVMKPIILMNAVIYRMWAFLQIERAYNGRWVLQVFCPLNETLVNDVKVELVVRTLDGKSFSARHKMSSSVSMSQGSAFSKGLALILFDSQLRVGENPRKLFDYQITIMTNEDFRNRINYKNQEVGGPLLMNDYKETIFPPLRPPQNNLCHAMVEVHAHSPPTIPELFAGVGTTSTNTISVSPLLHTEARGAAGLLSGTTDTEADGGEEVSVPLPEVVTSPEASEGEVVSGPTDDRSVTPEVPIQVAPDGPVGEVVNEVEVPATLGVVANPFFRGCMWLQWSQTQKMMNILKKILQEVEKFQDRRRKRTVRTNFPQMVRHLKMDIPTLSYD